MYKIRILVSLLPYLCLVAVPSWAADFGGRSMADTMLDMMEAMGRFSRDYIGSRDQGQFYNNREPMPPTVESRMPRSAPPATALDGDWKGAGGEQLAIRGSKFRLVAGPKRRLDGRMQTRGKLLALYSPRHRQTWFYEYATHRNCLVLRSTEGALLLFQRIEPADREIAPTDRKPPGDTGTDPRRGNERRSDHNFAPSDNFVPGG